MPIDIVVNGYFRSGTTFLWDYLKNVLKERGYLSFYEPLHQDLGLLIKKEIKIKKKNKLHNMYLFEDYAKLPEGLLLNILRDNPNANNNGILSSKDLKFYLDYFHSLDTKVFLQPNRLHFHLDLLFENYTNKVIHVIRHPLDVWLSIIRSIYAFDEIKLKKFARWLLNPIRMKNAYEIDKQYKWIRNRLGYPLYYRDSLYLRFFNYFNAFEKFVVVWTISNYYAIKTIERYNGLLIPYEYILDNPREFKNLLSNFLGIDISDIPNVKKGNYFKFSTKNKEKLFKVVKKYSIEAEFEYILEKIRKNFQIEY